MWSNKDIAMYIFDDIEYNELLLNSMEYANKRTSKTVREKAEQTMNFVVSMYTLAISAFI